MKTTLDLDDELAAAAMALAVRQRTGLTRLIEEGLRLRLKVQASAAQQRGLGLAVFEGQGGLVVGIDPLSNKAVRDALGEHS